MAGGVLFVGNGMSKRVTLLLIAALTASNLIVVNLALASVTTPSVPEFTVKFVDNSYDVPPTTTSSTDPYTNKTTITTVPGYHVENKMIEATIRNNLGASYYNFRYKPHYINEWSYYPFNPESFAGYNVYSDYALPADVAASASDYTVIPLTFLPKSIPDCGQVDVQVQALFGGYRQGSAASVFAPGGPTFDFYFTGTTSDWSETQTVTFGEVQSPTSSPAAPEQVNTTFVVVIAALVLGAALGLPFYFKKRRG